MEALPESEMALEGAAFALAPRWRSDAVRRTTGHVPFRISSAYSRELIKALGLAGTKKQALAAAGGKGIGANRRDPTPLFPTI